MKKEKPEDLSGFQGWYSTYGILTSQRILERYHIDIPAAKISLLVSYRHNIFNHFLRVPMKQVFNGIIEQQAYDYQVYAQKLFVDFLTSGQDNKDENSPGGDTRENLEETRQELISLGKTFREKCHQRSQSIAKTQKQFIELGEKLKQIMSDQTSKILDSVASIPNNEKNKYAIYQALITTMITNDSQASFGSQFWKETEKLLKVDHSSIPKTDFDSFIKDIKNISDEISSLNQQHIPDIDSIESSLKQYRKDFYEIILKITELLQQLPEYPHDVAQRTENLIPLHFDAHIGENSQDK